ncbi:unnamed protein product [Dovyalis caffra]|uniref:AP complex subunit sigma n=1 Tax=Dovyalis caffra TaxID=77055 RepID=A0AAV1RVT0_9ROSI|nr:unnamed protein product [Dovyalis caffra]
MICVISDSGFRFLCAIVLCSRADNVSNFIEADSIFGPDSRLVYKHYATLYFVFVFDSHENELAMLDLIQVSFMVYGLKIYCYLKWAFLYSQKEVVLALEMKINFIGHVPPNSIQCIVFVETLDKCFRNVCELDIVFNYSKLHTMVDEIILGGQVLETSSSEVMRAVEEISKSEAASNSISLVPKKVSGWRSRNRSLMR